MSLRIGLIGSLFVALMIGGCSGSDGDTGPEGPEGPQGPPGDPGEDGVAEPSINSVAPNVVFLERSSTVLISGSATDWSDGATADFGAGITVTDTVVASPTAILVAIDIAVGATEGFRDVSVTDAGETTTFEGAFTVESPLSNDAIIGTAAQGSVLFGRASMLDQSTPFDTLDDNANLSVYLDGSSAGFASAASPFALDYTVFVDVLATAGATDLVVESGFPTVTTSTLPGAINVAARTPTALATGTTTATYSEAAGTLLFQLDAPADSTVTVDVTPADTDAEPVLLLLPASGAFEDLIDALPSHTFATGATAETYYVVYFDGTGTMGYDIDVGVIALSDFPEEEPNDDDTTATSVPAGGGVGVGDIGVSGDEDWYAVAALTDDVITATVIDGTVDTCAPAGNIDSEIELLDTDGTTSLVFNDDINGSTNWCSQVSFTAPADGTYYVRVAASSAFCGACTFDYNVAISVE